MLVVAQGLKKRPIKPAPVDDDVPSSSSPSSTWANLVGGAYYILAVSLGLDSPYHAELCMPHQVIWFDKFILLEAVLINPGVAPVHRLVSSLM
jgi:hypothetical protein